jgi:hypothetical protein
VSEAEKAFAANNLQQAEALTAFALKQNPNDSQAGYLSRIIERGKKVPQMSEKSMTTLNY